jgi:hypothetical protein
LVAFTLFSGEIPFTGNGTLATIRLTVIANGVTCLCLSPPGINDILVNSLGTGIAFTQKSGVFCNTSCLDHDIAVSKVAFSSTNIKVGSPVTISVNVANIGLNRENVTVTFKAGTINIGLRQILLDPGNKTIVKIQWNTTSIAVGTYTITVQATIVGASDANPANNVASGTLSITEPAPALPIVYIIGGVAAAAAALAATALLLRRRKRLVPPPAAGTGLPPSSPGKG